MTELEYIICEAESVGEISLYTRNQLLSALYETESSVNSLFESAYDLLDELNYSIVTESEQSEGIFTKLFKKIKELIDRILNKFRKNDPVQELKGTDKVVTNVDTDALVEETSRVIKNNDQLIHKKSIKMTSKDKKTIALISGGIIIATPRFLRNLSKLKRNIEVMKRQNEIMNEISEWEDYKRNVNDKLDECRDKLKNDKSMSKEEKEALKHGIATTVNCLNAVNRMKYQEY